MTRFLSVIAVLFCVNTFAYSQDHVVKGVVYEDINGNNRKDSREKGIAGVLISDGEQIVTTDEKGKYEMTVSDHCIIFAMKPKGYAFAINEFCQPQNWYIHKPAGSPDGLKYPGSDPTGTLPKSLDFGLRRQEENPKFRFYAFGDPQPYSLKEVDYFIKGIVEEASAEKGDIAFGISLGDIVGDHLDLHPHYLNAIKGMEIPWYNVIGNHDRNREMMDEKYSNETFESHFGPVNHAFRYADTHFILLDDVIVNESLRPGSYTGGFNDSQLRFLENYEKYITPGELVVICYHIPIKYLEGQVNDSQRRRFLSIFEGHNVLGLSAHTHIQMQFYLNEKDGWKGPKDYHEYNVGTTNGDWYSGKIGKDGTPLARMRDGTPKGYGIVSVDGGSYICDYKVAREPQSKRMSVYSPKIVPYKRGGKYPMYVNFFNGGEKDIVEYRIGDGKWTKMSKVTNETDPYFMNEVFEWDRATEPMEGRRPNSVPTMCTHLWKTVLDNTLKPGVHTVEIRVKDQFGRIFKETHKYETR